MTNHADLEAAIRVALTAHAGQVDKAGQPYILHPLRVMMSLDEPKRRVAAVLHDVVEDSDLAIDDIEEMFGLEIGAAIDALTKRPDEDYSSFIERCAANDIARGVKWADLKDNMDMSRLPVITREDEARYEKYKIARNRLTRAAIIAQGGEAR